MMAVQEHEKEGEGLILAKKAAKMIGLSIGAWSLSFG
jgi:hypothetical protein